MSKALEKRGETALALPAEEIPAPVNVIALSNEPYWQRVRRIVGWQMKEYVKKDFSYSVLTGLFLGAVALLLEGGIDITAVYWAVTGLAAVNRGKRLNISCKSYFDFESAVICDGLL